MADRRHNGEPGYQPTKPEVVAEHPYSKIALMISVPLGIGLLGFLTVYMINDIKGDIAQNHLIQSEALQQINVNVTDISLNRQAIDVIEDDVEDLGVTDGKLWRTISKKADK